MKRLTCHIVVGKFEFSFVNNIEIQSSWKTLTDTALIRLPRNIKWNGNDLREEIKKGDEVQISLGYDFENNIEFSGFVSEIGANVPVTISCEDRMWQLKQKKVVKAWKSVSLSEMLSEILPDGVDFDAIAFQIGSFRINNATPAKVLQSLRQKYGLVSFFRDNLLYVGFPYSQIQGEERQYDFNKNIISSSLQYVREDDVKINVRAISIFPDNTKIEKQVGDPDGEVHTLHFFKLSESELQKSAEEKLTRLRYAGYKGSFESFGQPFCQHGDSALLNDKNYPERSGAYLVDEVRTRFGVNGFRKIIKIGKIA